MTRMDTGGVGAGQGGGSAGGRGTLREAIDAIELQIARLRDWCRQFGDHDRYSNARDALGCLENLASDLKSTGTETSPLFGSDAPCPDQPPVVLVQLGQGEYRRNVCGHPQTGRLDVQG